VCVSESEFERVRVCVSNRKREGESVRESLSEQLRNIVCVCVYVV
jgi:hypothetical protein